MSDSSAFTSSDIMFGLGTFSGRPIILCARFFPAVFAAPTAKPCTASGNFEITNLEVAENRFLLESNRLPPILPPTIFFFIYLCRSIVFIMIFLISLLQIKMVSYSFTIEVDFIVALVCDAHRYPRYIRYTINWNVQNLRGPYRYYMSGRHGWTEA